MHTKNRVFGNEFKTTITNQQGVNVVYKTDNLDIFRLSKFNRNIFLRKEMLEQAKQGFISPIIVNENMVVIDGQHRLEASKKVGVPVEYIIKQGLDEDDIVRMNTVQKPWSLQNYIESYANQGNEEYIRLINLVNEKYTNVTVTANVAVDKTFDSDVAKRKIKNGDFEFHNFDKAVEFLHYYKRFREETKTPKRSTVALAIYELFRLEGYNKQRMIEKVLSTGLDEEIKVKTFKFSDILKSLIDAYNHRLRANSRDIIEYYITSYGAIVIKNERQPWTSKQVTSDKNE